MLPSRGFSLDRDARRISRSYVLLLRLTTLLVSAAVIDAQSPPPNNVTYFTDPAPSVTSTPKPDGTVEVVLHKELSGYPNYGVADGRSDILYTGEVATWHFSLGSVDPATVRSSFFRAALIADDHYGVDLGAYRLASWVNGQYMGEGIANLPHGSPFGSRFSNWVQRDYPIATPVPASSITLFNTSGVGNWFAVDWIELHLITGTVQTGKPQLLLVSPLKGGNQGNVSVIIRGTAFPAQAGPISAKLTAVGKPTVTGLYAEQISPTQILTTFDLRTASSGPRDLIVTFSDGTSSSLNAGFAVMNGGASEMSVHLIGPSVARVNRDTTFIAVLENVGLNDAGLESLQVDVGTSAAAVATPTAMATSAAAGLLNSVVGGLAPGASIAMPFIARFQNCSNVNLSSQDQPDICDQLRAEQERLQDEVNALDVQITLLEAKVAFIQSQIDTCKCESLAPLCSLANCAALLVQRAWLQNELANHRQSLADVLRRLKAITARIDEECGPSSSVRSASQFQTLASASASATTQATICPVFSWDPNDKTGPMGAGPGKYIGYGSELPYTVFFENKAAATAPAQDVVVTDNLDTNLDWSRVTLGAIKFGNQVVRPPEGVQTHTTSVDLRPTQNLLVNIDASINPLTGVLRCTFGSVDPTTGQPPTDPLLGFLPPNKIPPQGEGSISYSAFLKASVATGTTVTNQARIFFDTNPPIDTPVWSNLVDTSTPISGVLALPRNQASQAFNVQWQGTDVGSGIHDYTIYVADNGGPYLPWMVATTSTQATYNGQLGHIYSFFSISRDFVGNQESTKSSPDATTSVGQPPCAPDLSSQVNVVRGGFRLNNASGRFIQSVSVSNKAVLPLALPIYLVLDKLSPNAALFNKTGDTLCAAPTGDPLISGGEPNAILQSGASVSVTLEFLNPSNTGISYETRVLGSVGVK